jgi:type I restriction enzyme S subunit
VFDAEAHELEECISKIWLQFLVDCGEYLMPPLDWEADCRLRDLCSVKHGFAFKGRFMTTDDTDDLPIVVNIGNFRYTGGFRFESTKIQRYTGEYPSEYELKPGDILLVMTCQTSGGEILGVPGRIPNDGRIYLHNQRMGLVVLKDSQKAAWFRIPGS